MYIHIYGGIMSHGIFYKQEKIIQNEEILGLGMQLSSGVFAQHVQSPGFNSQPHNRKRKDVKLKCKLQNKIIQLLQVLAWSCNFETLRNILQSIPRTSKNQFFLESNCQVIWLTFHSRRPAYDIRTRKALGTIVCKEICAVFPLGLTWGFQLQLR